MRKRKRKKENETNYSQIFKVYFSANIFFVKKQITYFVSKNVVTIINSLKKGIDDQSKIRGVIRNVTKCSRQSRIDIPYH